MPQSLENGIEGVKEPVAAATAAAEGTGPLGWDPGWASLQHGMVQLYTRGRPRTIHQFWQRCYFDDLWSLMGDRAAQARYLELGAGRGTTSMYLAARSCAVTMLDLSRNGFELARRNFAREGLPLPNLVLADARQTGLSAESFDCVFSIGLLEHFDDPQPVLRETLRLLAPGGMAFMVVIPARPAHVRLLAQTLFCPWQALRTLMPGSVKRLLGHRKLDRTGRADGGDVLRTSHSRSSYVRTMLDLGAQEVSCVPYNAYHEVYRKPALQNGIAVPLYRAHHAVKRLWARPPYFRTAACLASCDLLTFRKPA